MSSIASATKVIKEIAALIGAGVLLAEAIEMAAKKFGITKREVRRLWRAYGPG